jgi:hypothetical protein
MTVEVITAILPIAVPIAFHPVSGRRGHRGGWTVLGPI